MTIKLFLAVLIFIIASGSYIFKYYPDYLYIYVFATFFAAVIGEFIRLFYYRQKSAGSLEKTVHSNRTPQDDGEYHNDFSKVPAGEIDPNALPPMPRNYVIINPYKEFEESLNHDLRNIGIEIEGSDKVTQFKEKKNE